jgi:hypothetical protein
MRRSNHNLFLPSQLQQRHSQPLNVTHLRMSVGASDRHTVTEASAPEPAGEHSFAGLGE